MMDAEYIKDRLAIEVRHISNLELQKFARVCLTRLPNHFWTQPSSSSGKYHPRDEQEFGGLALHTIRTCQVAEIMLKTRMPNIFPDVTLLACMFHDVGRYGLGQKPSDHSLDDHPMVGALFMEGSINTYNWNSEEAKELATNSIEPIRCHMGRWGTQRVVSYEAWLVHLADMVASQYTP